MSEKPNKEQVKDAVTTLISHYGSKFVKWFSEKCPKLSKAIAGVVICLVGGVMMLFLIGVSGQDPFEFIFGKLSEMTEENKTNIQETVSNEWSKIVHPSNDCQNVRTVVETIGTNTDVRIDK